MGCVRLIGRPFRKLRALARAPFMFAQSTDNILDVGCFHFLPGGVVAEFQEGVKVEGKAHGSLPVEIGGPPQTWQPSAAGT